MSNQYYYLTYNRLITNNNNVIIGKSTVGRTTDDDCMVRMPGIRTASGMRTHYKLSRLNLLCLRPHRAEALSDAFV